jgi:uncharacterized protein YjiS (DUF1127 family)
MYRIILASSTDCTEMIKMSTTLSTLFRLPVTRRPSAAIWRLVHSWACDIARYHERRIALKRLGELSDRELHDIGLTRGELEAAVCGSMPRRDPGRMS